MDNMKRRRLQELDRSDFEVVKGEPDIRGWDVVNSRGQKIGEVEDLILDAQEKRVRYMIVDLDDNELKLDHRKVLLPIGLAELDKDEDDVIIPSVSPEQLRALPDYDSDHLTPDVERRICTSLGRQIRPGTTHASTSKTEHTQTVRHAEENDEETDPEFYKHEYYNLDNLYKHRLHTAKSASDQSEYERGLKLWERRSEGGIINDPRSEEHRQKEISNDERGELVRTRRNSYKERRYRDSGGKRKSIIDRTRDEGLQDG